MKDPRLFIYGLITIIVFWLVFELMQETGLVKSSQERRGQREQDKLQRKADLAYLTLQDIDYFKPNYWDGKNKHQLIDQDKADLLAEGLHDALSGWGTNETEIFAIFRNLTTGAQISQVAFGYKALYNADLLTDLIDDLNEDELFSLLTIINNNTRNRIFG